MKRGPRRGAPRALEPVTASAAIAKALTLHGISDEVRANRLLTEWSDLVGPKIASRTRPDGITDRILWIEVATSAWLHELNLLRPQIIAGLVERLGEPRLFEELRFKLAGRTRKNQVTLKPRPPPPIMRTVALAPASGARREAIVRDVAHVDDAELRELIARVRITHDK